MPISTLWIWHDPHITFYGFPTKTWNLSFLRKLTQFTRTRTIELSVVEDNREKQKIAKRGEKVTINNLPKGDSPEKDNRK